MKKIEEFLLNYKSKSTKRTYKCFLNKFFHLMKSDPEKYLKEKRDYEKDVKRFWQELNDNPPKTIFTAMTIIRVFLAENDIELPTKFWRGIRNRTQGSRPVTEDIIPTNQELKKILSHGDVRGRAIFLILSSSGMRIGEVSQINLKDIDYDITPTKINIRAEISKTGNRRICFISTEATEQLKAWLQHRETYLNAAVNRARIFEKYYNREQKKTIQDNRVFPFSSGTVRDIWNRLLANAEFDDVDERTRVHKMHPHVLRKFYRTHMSLNIPVDVVEALMGHEGYLTQAYRRYSPDQLKELYLKGEPNLSVFEIAPDLTGVNEQLKEKERQIQELRDQMQMLMAKVLTLDDKEKKDQDKP